jgi:hypothetical protein
VTKYEIYLLGLCIFFITLNTLKNILTIFFWNPFTLYYISHYNNASNVLLRLLIGLIYFFDFLYRMLGL